MHEHAATVVLVYEVMRKDLQRITKIKFFL